MILAAGESKRYGSNKLLSLYKGKYLLDHTVDFVRDNFNEKLIVLGKYCEQIKQTIDLEGFEVVYNENYVQGLSSSLKKAIKSVKTEWAMIFLGDMPKMKKDFIKLLLNKIDKIHDAYYLSYNGVKGFPVLINSNLYETVNSINGDKGLRDILKDNSLSLKIMVDDPDCIFDVDVVNENV